MSTDFQNLFTDRFVSEYTRKSSLIVPPHLKRVAALPGYVSRTRVVRASFPIANVAKRSGIVGTTTLRMCAAMLLSDIY